jgi:hypothetical protein
MLTCKPVLHVAGIMMFRSKSLELVKEWIDVIEKDDKVWDQNAFNDLFRRCVCAVCVCTCECVYACMCICMCVRVQSVVNVRLCASVCASTILYVISVYPKSTVPIPTCMHAILLRATFSHVLSPFTTPLHFPTHSLTSPLPPLLPHPRTAFVTI